MSKLRKRAKRDRKRRANNRRPSMGEPFTEAWYWNVFRAGLEPLARHIKREMGRP